MRKHPARHQRYRIGQGPYRMKDNGRMARNSEPVELSLVLFHETPAAYLVGETGDRDKAVWLPMKHAAIDERPQGEEAEIIEGIVTRRKLPIHVFLVSEWLANERGLL